MKNRFNKDDVKQKILSNIEFFSKRRYDFIIFLMVISYWNLSSTNDDLVEMVKNKDKYIEKISTYTTYITDNGIIKQYEKETFDVYEEKNNVANVLSKYLVTSAFNLTDGYSTTYFADENELFKNSDIFSIFYKNYIMINEDIATKTQIESNKQVMNDWKQILKWFRLAVNKNNLPHSIDKKFTGIDIKKWTTKTNSFKITFSMPVYANSLNKNNARDEGLAQVTIEASGYYNLLEKTTINSYGMKFTNLKLTHPMIDHSKRK